MDRTILRPHGCGIAVALAICVLWGAAATPAQAQPGPAILSPKAGQRLPAGSVAIRVRTAGGALLAATLNGRSIVAQLGAPRRGVRTLQASPSHGLRHGRNLLRVRLRLGRRTRTLSVRFRVAGARPLAAAGLDRFAAVGDHLVLDAAESRAPPGLGGVGRLRFRWKIVRRPRAARASGHARAAPARAAGLVGATSTTATFTPDRVGTYTLLLAARAPNGAVGSDLVDVRVDPPPAVRVDTNGRQGNQPGVAIQGPTAATSAFYPGDPNKWLQIVVLRRSDLSLVSNRSYDCPQATAHPSPSQVSEVAPCQDKVRSDLSHLDERELVIAASQGGPSNQQPPIGMVRALDKIGVQPWNWWNPNFSVLHGTFSAIGVPDRPSLIVEHPALGNQGPLASISDDLALVNDVNKPLVPAEYTFAPAEHGTLNTQAPGSDGSQNVIQIAGQRFVFPRPTNSKGGFEVLAVDPRNLTAETHWFELGKSSIPDQDVGAMRDTLNRISDSASAPFGAGKLVIVATRGSLDTTEALTPISDDVLSSTASAIERVGGTRSRFFDAVIHGRSYTLVGRASTGPGEGTEVIGSGAGPWGLNSVPLQGTVARTGPYYDYRVETADPFSAGGGPDPSVGATQLLQTSGQAQTPWPEQGNPGRTAAIAYLGTKVLGTTEPRGQYWTQPYDSTTWDGVSAAIAPVPYPIPKAPFSQADLDWAKGELLQEIAWLKSVHTYVSALARPFKQSIFESWSDLGSIATDINTKVLANGDHQAHLKTQAFFDFLLELGEEAPVVGKAVAVEAKMYRAIMEYAAIDNEPALDDFQVKVAEAGKALVRRFTTAQGVLTTQYANAIVSDYGRLKTTGACASVIASDWVNCPFDHADWQYTQIDQGSAAGALQSGAKVEAYGALLPAKYEAWTLPVNQRTTANDAFAGLLYFRCWYPFGAAPASAQWARQVQRRVAGTGQDTYEITALGYRTGAGTIGNDWEMHVPDASVTDPVFKSGGSNLGVNQEEFFDRFFGSRNRDWHYPERDTRTGWLPDCAPRGLAGRPSTPRTLSLTTASRRGIPVGFDVATSGSSVDVALFLGTSRDARLTLRQGSLLLHERLRNATSGRHTIGVRLSAAIARQIRRSGRHRTTLRIRVRARGGRTTTSFRALSLRY